MDRRAAAKEVPMFSRRESFVFDSVHTESNHDFVYNTGSVGGLAVEVVARDGNIRKLLPIYRIWDHWEKRVAAY
jgi:hypothetical protein